MLASDQNPMEIKYVDYANHYTKKTFVAEKNRTIYFSLHLRNNGKYLDHYCTVDNIVIQGKTIWREAPKIE